MSCSKYFDLLGSDTCLVTFLGQVLVFQHAQDRYLPCHTLMTGTYFATCSGQIPVLPHTQDRYMYYHMLRTGTGLATCSEQVLILPHAQDRYWSCHMLSTGTGLATCLYLVLLTYLIQTQCLQQTVLFLNYSSTTFLTKKDRYMLTCILFGIYFMNTFKDF